MGCRRRFGERGIIQVLSIGGCLIRWRLGGTGSFGALEMKLLLGFHVCTWSCVVVQSLNENVILGQVSIGDALELRVNLNNGQR